MRKRPGGHSSGREKRDLRHSLDVTGESPCLKWMAMALQLRQPAQVAAILCFLRERLPPTDFLNCGRMTVRHAASADEAAMRLLRAKALGQSSARIAAICASMSTRIAASSARVSPVAAGRSGGGSGSRGCQGCAPAKPDPAIIQARHRLPAAMPSRAIMGRTCATANRAMPSLLAGA